MKNNRTKKLLFALLIFALLLMLSNCAYGDKARKDANLQLAQTEEVSEKFTEPPEGWKIERYSSFEYWVKDNWEVFPGSDFINYKNLTGSDTKSFNYIIDIIRVRKEWSNDYLDGEQVITVSEEEGTKWVNTEIPLLNYNNICIFHVSYKEGDDDASKDAEIFLNSIKAVDLQAEMQEHLDQVGKTSSDIKAKYPKIKVDDDPTHFGIYLTEKNMDSVGEYSFIFSWEDYVDGEIKNAAVCTGIAAPVSSFFPDFNETISVKDFLKKYELDGEYRFIGEARFDHVLEFEKDGFDWVISTSEKGVVNKYDTVEIFPIGEHPVKSI